ncbi:lysine--tRNA ligase [Candidatus Saccharibacteria bacterium]|nr:lysine--tRNA ligase [Candidatus Saccharibacteria bacterium]
MRWLIKIVDEIIARYPAGEILIESGGSPSGTHHLGHLRELVTADAILLELGRRGRKARHIYFVDDLDGLRKIPTNVPANFKKYLGRSLYDIPSPDFSDISYADYFLQGLVNACSTLRIEVEFIRSHHKYQTGFFVSAIEKSLEQADKVRHVLETVSGHSLGLEWSPIQINEEGYLKKRRFLAINTDAKTVDYEDRDGKQKSINYANGDVKLDWRIDWPARWQLLGVHVEPFGRDHGSSGGSYDTGAALSKDVFENTPPYPVPYDFVNMAGDTKKMSASKGTGLDAEGVIKVLPPEIVRFFMLRYPPEKRLYFDPLHVAQLIDDFTELLTKSPETALIAFSKTTLDPTISKIPFSHMVESYQASLKNPESTLLTLSRTGYQKIVNQNKQIILDELKYIEAWLQKWAPEEIKFELIDDVDTASFSQEERSYLNKLSLKIEEASEDSNGEWFHKAIYELKDFSGLEPKQLFTAIYKATIGKESGPRAGWFLSILPRDWLIKRLKFEDQL